MNLLNKALLRLVLLPQGFYRRWDVNPTQLKAILEVKLTMDDRRPNTFHQTRQHKKEGPIKASTLGTVLLSALFGLTLLSAFLMGDNIVLQLAFYYSFFILMLGMTLISDFTSVLIDVRDNFIILPRPVNDRTFVLAKILHILIHIGRIAIPMGLPAFGFLLYLRGGAAGLLFALMTALATLFTIFLVNAFYLLILKVTRPQKFQSIISYIQIFFAVGFYGGSQLLPRGLDLLDVKNAHLAASPLWLLAPPYWFSAGWNVLHSLAGTPLEWAGSFLSIGAPATGLLVVVRYLAPAFNSKLALLGTGTATEGAKEPQAKATTGGWMAFFGKLLTRSGAEKMGFLFTLRMIARSRDFRMKVYPSIGYFVVVLVGMFYNLRQMSRGKENPDLTSIFILGIYVSNFVVLTAIHQVKYSEKYKAAWLFFVAPITRPGEVIRGSMKACLLLFYLPAALLLCGAGLALGGPQLLPDAFLGVMNQLLIISVLMYLQHRQLPFSLPDNANSKGDTILQSFLLLFISGIAGGLHYLLHGFPAVVLVLGLLSLGATWLMRDTIRQTTWKELRRGE
ncbi:hypothetical protein V9K67_19290 [Paraflavisolibacter sp. H34]|uniref:hypothetical protein n=1 Tax=Huijunlia imazamoxiresistens TaxID=3127457 RepID=UPI003017DD27